MPSTSLFAYAAYAIDPNVDPAAVTNYGGLFPYLDLVLLTRLPEIVTRCLPTPREGWRPAELVAALLAVNLTGGECVEDLETLRADPGLALYMGQIVRATPGPRRFARGGASVLPSRTVMREWLETFHAPAEEAKRVAGTAFIPAANAALQGLQTAGRQFLTTAWALYQRSGRPAITRATLEIDTTFMETQKAQALACYKKFDAYSALLVRWAETGFVVWDQFRDGNVPPAFGNLTALTEAITFFNTDLGITDVWVRSDAAACQHDLLDALDGWQLDGRACPVRFAIGYIKTAAFRAAVRQVPEEDWAPVYDTKGRLLYEVAEVPFVSAREARVPGEPYRHLAIRRKTKQGMLPGLDVDQPARTDEETIELAGTAYHLFAIISNIPVWTPCAIVAWYNGRCGGGEAINSVLKSDLAGGQLPAKYFGANAAWWAVVVLAWNLHALLRLLALPGELKDARFKRLRFHFINVPARLVQHARQCVVRYFQAGVLGLIQQMRGALRALARC